MALFRYRARDACKRSEFFPQKEKSVCQQKKIWQNRYQFDHDNTVGGRYHKFTYGYLFLWFLVRRKRLCGQEKGAGRALRNLVICAAVSVLAYLPWLFVLISQVTAVRENYWIHPIAGSI